MCYDLPIHTVSYHRHRFPPDIIQNAVWLYFRFPLSFRDVEDLLAQRGIDVSYETVRRWSEKFGLAYARKLRRSHPPADRRWHLDEVFVSINGRSMYLWRAVDCEGEVLDVLVQSRRDKRAALKLMRKLLKTQGFVPAAIVTDYLPSYGAGPRTLTCQSGRENDERRSSSQLRQPRDFFQHTPPSTTPSTSSVISSPVRHFASFAAKMRTWQVVTAAA